eukprot:TRINITY_DN102519_c0_g1_i1.p1 TRINITY_DN102519_c0_g1~~TRINITY_DN102519_c0_g1_i1.p1  ORF type:complete len:301 (+),score=114.89 TRINITY_DN102519_c0_g1_i1:62-964(+)
MAEAPGSLGDFFAKKNKKKIKGVNLNNATADKKDEDKKPEKKKDNKDEEGWQEEEVVQATMKVGAAGNLVREEEKNEEEETSAPAWGKLKVQSNAGLNEKRFPTLAKSVAAIDMEDNSQKINISTSKNMFANLEDDDDDEEEGPKRPKEIKPAMITKKKGEKHQDAVEREVGKYKPEKASKGKTQQKDEDEEEQHIVEKTEKEIKTKKKKEVKAQESSEQKEKADDGEVKDHDVMIQADLVAAKAKYAKRRRLLRKELPASEMEEEKENRPVPQNAGKSKKKWAVTEEEDTEKKLQYLED